MHLGPTLEGGPQMKSRWVALWVAALCSSCKTSCGKVAEGSHHGVWVLLTQEV